MKTSTALQLSAKTSVMARQSSIWLSGGLVRSGEMRPTSGQASKLVGDESKQMQTVCLGRTTVFQGKATIVANASGATAPDTVKA